ncbi:MAG TPA: TSUP family transporter [Kofleriaceae bacterium]|nr:TSUP family transporter [Kofleriaceae bacterium]
MDAFVLDPRLLVILGVVALTSFATEGAIGFGGTVLAVSLGAALAIPLALLLPAFVPLNLLMSAWLLSRGFSVVGWRMLAREVAPAVGIGTAIGLALFHLPAKQLFAFGFGVFVIGLATLQLVRPAEKDLPRALRWLLLGLGGVVHGLFGTGGPMIVYVARRRLPDKRAFRSTLAVLWIVLNIALLTNYASEHMYTVTTFKISGVIALMIVPGLFVGDRIHHKLDAARFERVVWVVLLFAGFAVAIRNAHALYG